MIDEEVCPPGVQLYVPPPIDGVAVSVELAPLQMVEEFTATVGCGFTVIALEVVAEQPLSV